MDKMNDTQLERYCRQTILAGIGENGQERLFAARVLIIGLGGLGSPAAIYLAAAGVGTIGIVDSSEVELSNLHRQILYAAKDIGKDKVLSAKERLSAINDETKIITHKLTIDRHNIADIIKEFDIVLDCSDNFSTKYLINDACILSRKPFVHGSVLGFEGHALTVLPGKGPCYRCLFPEAPPQGAMPSPQQAGVFAPIAGIIGTIQAAEVIKYILQIGGLLSGELLVFNLLASSYQKIKLNKDPQCPACEQKG